MLQLFEEVENQQYIWKLFYLVNHISPSVSERESVRMVDNIRIVKRLASGYGVNLAQEEALLEKCKGVRIFTKEIELALLSDDREMYLYSSVNDEPIALHQIGVVDKYVYISEDEIATPVLINDGEGYTDEYFLNLKEYVLEDMTETDGYKLIFENGIFTMSYQDEELCRLENIDKALSYPFVLYLLIKLAEEQPVCGFETKFDLKRIRKKTIT